MTELDIVAKFFSGIMFAGRAVEHTGAARYRQWGGNSVPDTSEEGFARSSATIGQKGRLSFAPAKSFLTVLMALALLLGTLGTAIATLAITTATPAGALGVPSVTSVSPDTGPIAGGTSVTITGTGFDNSSVVDFGATVATGVVVNSATQITVPSPAGTPGTVSVDITVTTTAGTSQTSSADNFQYATNELEDCYATTSDGNQSASSNRQLVSYTTPGAVLPGGAFTLTWSDPGNQFVDPTSGSYGISGITNSVLKLDVPANTTVVSGPTITMPGYYYTPPSGAHTTMTGETVSLINDSATPAGPTNTQNNGQEVEWAYSGNIPGGDDYVQPTITIGLQLNAAPTTDFITSTVLNVQPVGTAVTSTDPGDDFTITVTGTPVGNVAANTSCWPFPNPQPPFVDTPITDAVPPAITIASPGNATQVVQNSKVAAAFGCVDPPSWGNGIKYCTATNDGTPITPGTDINTSTLGSHTVIVNASNNSGTTSTSTSNYTVIAPPYNLVPPAITLTIPANGAQYITGSTVDASYSCVANSGTTTCNGSVANGTPISTTAGYHTFTVSALDTRGNPSTTTVGYYARTSNTPTSTSVVQSISYPINPGNEDCAVGSNYYKITLSIINTKETCNSSTNAEIDTKATAPAANGGQLAVGDTITVQQQIYKPGYQATAANGGYYSGPYDMNFTLSAPTGTTINGPITSSTTGLPSTTFGGTATASAASACNYGANATTGTGVCSATPAGALASTTSSASGATTVGATGATTVANPGSATGGANTATTVGSYGSQTVGTLYASTVSSASNGQNVASLTSSTLNVTSISGAPTATGNRLEVTTTGGVSPAVLAYTGTSTGKFTGITVISGSGTVATGAVVQQPLNVANMNNLPISAATGLRTTGTNQITVATTGGSGTATLQYTSEGTSTANCGTSPCFLGITVISGSGTVAKGNAIFQAPFAGTGILPATTVTGFTTGGSLNVTLGGNPAVVAYTGTSTTAATCGAAACFTGVTLTSGSGTATAGSAISQFQPNVNTFTSANGIIPTSAAISGFPSSGTLTATTSNGATSFTYTGTSTTAGTCGTAGCFTGVTTLSGGSGTLTPGATITQVRPDVSTFAGAGILPVASVTGFTGTGTITAGTSNGTATFTYTATSTTATTCGSAACFTGVTTQGGASGSLTGGSTVGQVLPNISTFTGSGVVPAASVTGFSASGSISAATSGGTGVFSYTGTSTTAATCGSAACFTGVTTVSGTGTLTPGGAITQNLDNVNTFSNSTLSVAASTNFSAPGLVSVATSGGTAYLSFSGTGTGTLTGATYQGGANGTVVGGGAVVQANGLTQNLDAFGNLAAGSSSTSVSAYTGSGTLNLTSATATPWTAPGTIEVNTTNGVQNFTFTGISGNSLTGVSAPAGGSGSVFTGALVGQAAPTFAMGATSVNGTSVSGYNWTVNANNATSVPIAWDDSSCENSAGQPPATSPSSNNGTPCNNQEQFGMDGSFVYIQYELTVTKTGTITLPGLPVTNSTTSNNCYSSSLDSGTCWGSNPFVTTAAAAPGISWTAVDPAPPVATLNTPIQGAVYANGQVVDASYACSEPTSGVTITSCTGVEDAGTSYQTSVANGSPLNTTELIPNQIHTFTVTATNSEGYTSTSYATFIALANPPSLLNQAINDPIGTAVNVPFNYSGTYPANFSTEQIVTPPLHGTTSINPVNGSITYQSFNQPNATDSFQFSVSDTAGNPSNVETVNINMTDTNAPMITFVTPSPAGTDQDAYQSTVDANYTCSDLVPGAITSCTASQVVNGVPTSVPDGSPIDTSSLIVGNTHCLTVTAVNFFNLTSNSTACYTVNTPAPVANNDSATTINPQSVIVPVLNNDTSIFPINPSTVTVVENPTYGTTTVEPSGAIKYTPTTASTTAVTNDTFAYTVEDTDGQVSNEATVNITVYPVPGVAGVLPIAGPLTQGTPVVITGTGFATASGVNFGSTPASSFNIVSNTQIDAVAPAAPGGVPGTEDVTVTSLGGTTATSLADDYTWDPVPSLTSVSPGEGVVAGGATLTVDGTGFTSGQGGQTTVVLTQGAQSIPCTSVSVNQSGTQLTCTVGTSTTSGVFDTIVSTPGGTTTISPADQFNYFFPTPSVMTVSPTSGPPSGGTSVTITGNSFTGATSVSFGAIPATTFTVNSNTSITATAPAGTAGSRVDITVTGPGGTSGTLSADQFTYGPVVANVSPNSGPAAGGTSVTVTGSGFTSASAINFGSTASPLYTVNSDTSITATAPAGTGTVDVTVTTPNGTSPTSSVDTYTYLAPVPTVSGISPTSGPVTGGTVVTITGNGLAGETTVSFGANPGVIGSVSNTSITVTAPAGASGTVDVTVTTPGGTSATVPTDHFTYGPAVTGLSPQNGPSAGGTVVTITGNGFTGTTGVNFGANAGTNVTVNSNTSVTATSPAGTVGTVNVTVVTPAGTSPVVSADAFTYATSAPTVSSISPTTGPAAGGTSVTITGNGLSGATAVDFGAAAATGVSVNGAGTSITATSPAGTAGSTVSVTVTTPAGTSGAVASGQFTYGSTVTHISPATGLTTGGTSVTITGTGLSGATAVNFGSTAGSSMVVNSSTSITVVSPAEGPGTVDVTVVTPGGTTPTVTADQFTYHYPVPVISAMTPNVGKPSGGDSVTITGSGFTGATTVSFGATPATIVTVTNTSIVVTSPAGTAKSTVSVTVTGPGGTSALTSADNFTYGPVVTGVTPNTGSHLGGTTVTIKGAGFTGATAVNFGATAVTSGITVNAAGTQITVKAPAGSAGSVDITVTAGGVTSNTGSADLFTYV
jgi:hypothetical protein